MKDDIRGCKNSDTIWGTKTLKIEADLKKFTAEIEGYKKKGGAKQSELPF